MSETAYERVVVSMALRGWREMVARQAARAHVVRTLCPGLTIDSYLERDIVNLITVGNASGEGWLEDRTLSLEERLSA